MSPLGLTGSDSTKSPSTHHVFEVEALNLYRLSISFEVEEDNDFDGLEEDEELMRQLEEEMIDTMSGEAGGLVSAEINLKVCVYKRGWMQVTSCRGWWGKMGYPL